MGRLDGKVAIITGAAQGLGEALVKRFTEEGAKVVGVDLNEEKLKETIAKYGDEHLALKLDVTDGAGWESVVNTTVEKFGKLDVLVNNAAMMSNKGVLELNPEEYMKVMQVNSLGTMLGIQKSIPKMQENGGGSIVNIASIGGMKSGTADGGDAAYSASKGSVRALTKHVAHYFAKDNIRCSAVYPGGIMTDMLKKVFNDNPDLWEHVKVSSPLPNHIAEPEDIANGAIYLASDDAKAVTGTELVIDNGTMTH
ncbi:SDR family NAD(P)-dependent oxidoreductase [Oceanobacillus sp. CAU 1775]